MTESRPLDLPLTCVVCGRVAHFLINGTSVCRDHKH